MRYAIEYPTEDGTMNLARWTAAMVATFDNYDDAAFFAGKAERTFSLPMTVVEVINVLQ